LFFFFLAILIRTRVSIRCQQFLMNPDIFQQKTLFSLLLKLFWIQNEEIVLNLKITWLQWTMKSSSSPSRIYLIHLMHFFCKSTSFHEINVCADKHEKSFSIWQKLLQQQYIIFNYAFAFRKQINLKAFKNFIFILSSEISTTWCGTWCLMRWALCMLQTT
jgi:hypothetical protein